MRAPGIIGTVQLAATLVFATPLVIFGLSWLADGRVAGAGFVALGALMVLLQQYLTDPLDPGDVAEAAADRLTREEE